MEGTIFTTIKGGDCVVLKYSGNTKVLVRFLDGSGYEVEASLQALRNGFVKNPFHPRCFGVGFLGNSAPLERAIKGKSTKSYVRWNNMLERCFCPNRHNLNPWYLGTTVDSDWYNFDIFNKWHQIQTGNDISGWQLDKDLLSKTEKHYSPETCVFLPQKINAMLSYLEINVIRDLPIGVHWNKQGKNFHVMTQENGKRKNHYLKDKQEAFNIYRDYKESTIISAAEQYRKLLDPKAYEALISYKVRSGVEGIL